MGKVFHDIIAVTTFDSKAAEEAYCNAVDIFDGGVTPIHVSPINEYYTFVVLPDGSKEGWTASDIGDTRRKEFLDFLETFKYEDGSSPLEVASVRYGSDWDYYTGPGRGSSDAPAV